MTFLVNAQEVRRTFAEPFGKKQQALQDVRAMRAQRLQQLPKSHVRDKKTSFQDKNGIQPDVPL